MTEKPWRVEFEPAVQKELDRIRSQEPRGIDAVEALRRFLQRSPGDGYAVHRMPGALCRPFHTAVAAYVVVYECDDDTVTCIAIRKVPFGAF